MSYRNHIVFIFVFIFNDLDSGNVSNRSSAPTISLLTNPCLLTECDEIRAIK